MGGLGSGKGRKHRKYPPPAPGNRYGRLVVLGRAESTTEGKSMWSCRCDCGAVKPVRERLLIDERTRSCGCLAAELASARTKTHGKTHSPEWAAWHRMIGRCAPGQVGARPYYAGKGVRVCQRWLDSFEMFLKDMGPMPQERRTIDRICNDKGYEPGNCRWASIAEQNRNKSNNIKVTLGDRTQTVAEWAREIGMSQTGLHDRLKKMTIEEALTLPDQRGQKRWRNVA